MNFKKIIMSALLAVGCLNATAQETKTVEVFNPHWYIQGQIGGQYTLGETKFKDLSSLLAIASLLYGGSVLLSMDGRARVAHSSTTPTSLVM